ncbi:g6668 [Coccomyxa elongata]
MADGGSMQGRKRKLPSFMQPKSPASEPHPTSKKKKSKGAPRQRASPDTEVPKQVPREKQCEDAPGQTGSLNTKVREKVQTQLSFKKKPVQDRSHAFAVKPEPPKLPSLSPPESASAVRCSPRAMSTISDEQLLSQSHAWVNTHATQKQKPPKHPALQHLPADPGTVLNESIQEDRCQRAIEASQTPDAMARGIQQCAASQREPQESAKSDVILVSSQVVHADSAVQHQEVPSAGSDAREAEGMSAAAADEPVAPLSNDFCRSLLADLLGEDLPTTTTAPAAVSGQPHDRLMPEASPSYVENSRTEAHADRLTRQATGNGVVKQSDDSLLNADREGPQRAVPPPSEVRSSLPYSGSLGSHGSLKAGPAKKLSMRERIQMLQSQ